MSEKKDEDLYNGVDSITLKLEIDDPINSEDELSKKYTWRLKGYDDSVKNSDLIIDKDIIGEILEEDYPELKNPGKDAEEVPILRKEIPIRDESENWEIPTGEPHKTYKTKARALTRDIAINLKDDYDVDIDIDRDSFYDPEFDF